MKPKIAWITAVYDIREWNQNNEYRTKIGVPEAGRSELTRMIDDLEGTNGLVALYIPERTEGAYDPGERRGKIIGAAEVLPLRNRPLRDFAYPALDGSRRWPIGFPCRIVYDIPDNQCRTLREFVEFGLRADFGGWVHRLHSQPVKLEDELKAEISDYFAEFQPVA